MCLCENDFSQLIETNLIVANNQMKIEKTTEYLVSDVHSTRGYFAYTDDISNMSVTIKSKNTSSQVEGQGQTLDESILSINKQNSSQF